MGIALVLEIPRVDISRRKVYLDKDAFSLIWRSKVVPQRDLLRLRRRLLSPRFVARPNIVLSQWLFSEMASRIKSPLVERQIATEIEFLTQLPTFLFLRAPLEVMASEVACSLDGTPLDVFLDEGGQLPLDNQDTWQEELDLLSSDRATFVSFHKDGFARVRKHWPALGVLVKGLTKELRDDPERAVVGLALRAMKVDRHKIRLPNDETAWPKPQSLPSVWARASHQVMYAHLSTRDQRTPKPNDFHDWCHYVASAHADEFVTNDSWSKRVAEACPPPKPVILGFEAWAEQTLR